MELYGQESGATLVVACDRSPQYTVLVYAFGRRKDAVFLELQGLLEPFGIMRFYTDGWDAYERHIDAEQHVVGKQHTQTIESKHINLLDFGLFNEMR